MENLRIALVQMESRLGDITANLSKIRDFIQAARCKGVEIICFPELSLPGYHRNSKLVPAEPIPGPSSVAISQMARDAQMTVLAGIAEKSGTDNPYITQLVAFPDGTMKTYRKTHLGKSEQPYYTPGNDLPVFQGRKAPFAVQICWDLHFPEVTTILSLKGAEIIFAPHASPTIVGDRKEIWLKYLSARAYDNTVFVAACNLIGGNEQQSFCGGALVIDPKGNVLAEAFHNKEEMLIADLDSTVINTIRGQQSGSMRNSFYLASRRPELYRELVK